MTGGLKIGRVFGIDVRVRAGWLVIVGLLTASLATAVLPAMFEAGQATYWGLALVAALLLSASVLVHELAHALVARAQGIEVRGITLFLLGGVSTIEEEPGTPWREALMAGIGPVTSLALGGALLGVAALVPEPAAVHALALYLGTINLVLAAFNMLPGFPLDGGRVLRAVLWGLWHDRARATSGAATTGRVLGYALIGAGALFVLQGVLLSALWTAFVGWILIQSAGSAARLGEVEKRLQGVPAGRLAEAPAAWVPPRITLSAAMRDYLAPTRARCLPVAGGGEGEYEGALCAADVREIDPRRWDDVRVAEVMRGRDQAAEVGHDRPALDVLHGIASGRSEMIAIVREGRLLGLVDDQTLTEYVARAALGRELREHRAGSVHKLPDPPARGDSGHQRRAA